MKRAEALLKKLKVGQCWCNLSPFPTGTDHTEVCKQVQDYFAAKETADFKLLTDIVKEVGIVAKGLNDYKPLEQSQEPEEALRYRTAVLARLTELTPQIDALYWSAKRAIMEDGMPEWKVNVLMGNSPEGALKTLRESLVKRITDENRNINTFMWERREERRNQGR